MARWLPALLLLGCGGSPPALPPREATLFDRLRERTHGYASFLYRAELADGKQVVPLEMAWRAPDRAVLRYGRNYTSLFEGGVARTFTRQGTFRFDFAAETEALSKTYGLSPRGEPTVLFVLTDWEALLVGRAPRAALAWGVPGSRLGWIDDLRLFTPAGSAWRRGSIEIELRDDGFIGRAAVGQTHELTAREVRVNGPLDDALFAPPPEPGADLSAQARPSLRKSLEDSFHRWILDSDPTDADLETLVRVDLARRHVPEELVRVLREGLERTLDAYRKANPGAQPELLRAKKELERGKALGSAEVMEQEIQGEFERDLDRYFRGMAVLPSVERMRGLAARWRAAVARQVETQIRRPFDAVFGN